jgi:hypothetical protein
MMESGTNSLFVILAVRLPGIHVSRDGGGLLEGQRRGLEGC